MERFAPEQIASGRKFPAPGGRTENEVTEWRGGLCRTFAALAFAVTAMTGPALADDLVEFGREIAEVNCSACHAISTDDESRHSEALPLRELSQRYPVEALEEALVEGILVGHPDMPEFEATPEQANALIAYLNTIQHR